MNASVQKSELKGQAQVDCSIGIINLQIVGRTSLDLNAARNIDGAHWLENEVETGVVDGVLTNGDLQCGVEHQ